MTKRARYLNVFITKHKIIEVNKWIKNFNEENTGLKIDLDKLGVKNVPKMGDNSVQHDYDSWNEPQWPKMLHLNQDAKSIVAQQLLKVFDKLDRQIK